MCVQVQIRRLPKPVVAKVAGYCVGGGHVLHLVCDLTIAAENAVFGQTGPKVGSFDAGYGSTQMARIIGAPAHACRVPVLQLWLVIECRGTGSAEFAFDGLHLALTDALP